jgi:hypothetical protein
MILKTRFQAKGHPNIRSKHKTTIMTTVEPNLTTRGDCIIAVNAEIGLARLPTEIKKAARNADTKITFTLKTQNNSFEVHGNGHKNLTYRDTIDMVIRKSTYTCDRTLMVKADKAAIDIPTTIIKALQSHETPIIIELTYEKPDK